MPTITLPEIARFVDDPASNILWAIFLPDEIHNDDFAMFKVLKDVPGKKIYFSLSDKAFWRVPSAEDHRQKVALMYDVLSTIKENHSIESVIGLGHSRGANAVLLLGCLHNFDRIIATAPELEIGHSHSRSAELMPDAKYGNLVPFIENFSGRSIDIVLPCFSAREGINLLFAEKIKTPLCHVHHVPEGHTALLLRLTKHHPDMFNLLLEGKEIKLETSWNASEGEKVIAKASFELVSRLDKKEYEIPAVDDSISNNYEWFYFKAKALWISQKYQEAIMAAERSVSLKKETRYLIQLTDFYVKTKAFDKARLTCDLAAASKRLTDKHIAIITKLDEVIKRSNRQILEAAVD